MSNELLISKVSFRKCFIYRRNIRRVQIIAGSEPSSPSHRNAESVEKIWTDSVALCGRQSVVRTRLIFDGEAIRVVWPKKRYAVAVADRRITNSGQSRCSLKNFFYESRALHWIAI